MIIYICVHVCMSLQVLSLCRSPWRPEQAIRSPATEVKDGWRYHVAIGN